MKGTVQITNDSVQVIDYETGNTLMLNKRTIISASRVKTQERSASGATNGKTADKIRVHCFNNRVYILDMLPTVDNLKSIMP